MLLTHIKQKFQAVSGWVSVLVCVFSAMAFLAPSVQASCGDYLQHRFTSVAGVSNSSGSQNSIGRFSENELLKRQALKPVPPQKRCHSCRGATIPVTPPVAPPPVRIDLVAFTCASGSDCDAASLSSELEDHLPKISEGAYPSLLRPPIA